MKNLVQLVQKFLKTCSKLFLKEAPELVLQINLDRAVPGVSETSFEIKLSRKITRARHFVRLWVESWEENLFPESCKPKDIMVRCSPEVYKSLGPEEYFPIEFRVPGYYRRGTARIVVPKGCQEKQLLSAA